MSDRVECHCGWVRINELSPVAGSNLLERHHQEMHGLGTDWFYRPAPWAAPAQRCPWPTMRIFGWLAR